LFFTGTADLLIRVSKGVLAKRSSKTVRNHRNAVRNAPESLSAMDRNLQAIKEFREEREYARWETMVRLGSK
jgi:hypothetical protein